MFSNFFRLQASALLSLALLSSPAAVYAQTRLASETPALQVLLINKPAEGLVRLHVQNQAGGPVSMQVVDRRGHLLISEYSVKPAFVMPLNLVSLPAGDYTLRLSTRQTRYVQTLHVAPASDAIPEMAVAFGTPAWSPVDAPRLAKRP